MKYYILILLILQGIRHINGLDDEEDTSRTTASLIAIGLDVWVIVWYCNNIL